MATTPRFRDPNFLVGHIESVMNFYHPRCIDRTQGGFFHHFRDDGSIHDATTRHLVSSTRFVFNYAMAARFSTARTAGRPPAMASISCAGRIGSRRPAATPGSSPTAGCATALTTITAWPSSCSPTPTPWTRGSRKPGPISREAGN